MAWRETEVMEQRRQFVVRGKTAGANVRALCEEFGISRQTGYRWLRRYEAVGSLAALAEKSRRPRHIPGKTPDAVELRVEALRQQYGWSGKKLHVLLEQEGIRLPSGTIDRILRRRGLVHPRGPGRSAPDRFEWPRPNDLWQMDFKGPLRGLSATPCMPLSVLDDHSRYAVGLYPLTQLARTSVEPCLVECFERYGVPEAMLMDHGTPWWGTTNGHGLTQLSVWLIQQGIRLIYGAIGHPQTQGKVERFHRTLAASLHHRPPSGGMSGVRAALSAFREEYNHLRPHEALEMKVPAAVYTPSRKSYQASPKPWEYPPGADVRRLNSAGCLDYRRHRYFVCEALAHQNVQCQEFDEHVLVRFQHMEIREIDLRAGRTTAVVRPARTP